MALSIGRGRSALDGRKWGDRMCQVCHRVRLKVGSPQGRFATRFATCSKHVLKTGLQGSKSNDIGTSRCAIASACVLEVSHGLERRFILIYKRASIEHVSRNFATTWHIAIPWPAHFNHPVCWIPTRSDVFNKRITAIMQHCRSGGRVVVGGGC